MSAYVYLIKSEIREWYYIGCTNDLKKRILKHNNGQVKSTQFYKPFKLIYYETYNSLGLARKREYELKNNNYKKEILYKRLEIK